MAIQYLWWRPELEGKKLGYADFSGSMGTLDYTNPTQLSKHCYGGPLTVALLDMVVINVLVSVPLVTGVQTRLV